MRQSDDAARPPGSVRAMAVALVLVVGCAGSGRSVPIADATRALPSAEDSARSAPGSPPARDGTGASHPLAPAASSSPPPPGDRDPLAPAASSSSPPPGDRDPLAAAPAQLASEPLLDGDEPFIRLAVEGHRPAVVSLPLGAHDRRPLLVATHGAGGRPEAHCQLWRRIVGNRAFILCPAGSPTHPHAPELETGYYYRGHPALAAEVSAAIAALGERFASRLDVTDPVYAGYSQGATMGALVLPNHPAAFARALLVEGGSGEAREWNVAAARHFAQNGGRRLLIACGRPACAEAARTTVVYLQRGGVEARFVHVAGAGHTYLGPMEATLREGFAWLVQGDGRW